MPSAFRADDFLATAARAGKLLLLAPSSYLGSVCGSAILEKLSQRLPQVQVIAVDDYFISHPENARKAGFTKVISTGEMRGGGLERDVPLVNCAYSLPTWLVLQQLGEAIFDHCFDLPELLYALDIPLIYQTGGVTRELTEAHRSQFSVLRQRLGDELSQHTLEAIMRMRGDGNRLALLDVLCPIEQEYFSAFGGSGHPFRLNGDEHYVDIGAYDGDTVRKFLLAARYQYEAIHAFEPDPENYAAMCRSLAGSEFAGVQMHNQAVSDAKGFLSFAAKGTMGSRAEEGGDSQVECVRLDDVLEKMTFLKMDVEGHEASVLRGATELIRRCRPRMAITCYHHALDILDIVAAIDDILPGARLRLRHYSMYFYDTILYVDWPDKGH